MSEEEEKIRLCDEGGMLGMRVAAKFSPIVNFTMKIEHFVGDVDIGKFAIVMITMNSLFKC